MNVKLTSENEKLTTRTRVIKGDAQKLPKVGEPFGMVGQSLTPGIARVVETSWVTSVVQTGNEKHLSFKTETGSSYRLEILDE
tara:strand:+ start:1914 stop:2162 length:249 start_codon:yes stop_codon:yes gene_type:complete